jgi:SpoVK/Ycf46/Vps4 family AAA+-type ATPase
VARSLKGTLDIQQRRLENYNKADESLQVTEAELDRIEKQITLLAEETAVTSDPAMMSSRLDGVVQSLQGTTRWMSENAEFFGSLEEEPPPVNLLQGPPRTPEGG